MTLNDTGGDGAIRSSTDDGSSWSSERDVAFDGNWAMTHNSNGIMFFERDNAQPDMIFDADGVSLGSPVANPLATGTSEALANGGDDSLFSDALSVKPSRWLVATVNNAPEEAKVYYSDDDGATWNTWAVAGGNPAFPNDVTCKFGWDGEHYHVLFRSDFTDTTLWYRSRDGAYWAPGPLTVDAIATQIQDKIIFYDKPA